MEVRVMIREEKTQKKISRSKARREKRMRKYVDKIKSARLRGIPPYISLAGAIHGSWLDSNSPAGYSQICDYLGTCQSPCNGDC